MELTALGSDSVLPVLDRTSIFLEHIGNSFRCQTILRQLGRLRIFLETPMFPKQISIGRFGKAMLAFRTIERLARCGVRARCVRAIFGDGIVCRLIIRTVFSRTEARGRRIDHVALPRVRWCRPP